MYRLEIGPGITVAETIQRLSALPPDARFDEHFGDVDLLVVFRTRAPDDRGRLP
jgi:uncharacterized repeat protein (TIGR03917 family)